MIIFIIIIIVGLYYIGSKNAFDSVSHEILLKKLDHYGIQDPAHALIKSFLYRQQYVSLNGYNSKLRTNDYGAPQVSILGPLLFLLYVNDMSNALQSSRLFADDTSILLNHSNLDTI